MTIRIASRSSKLALAQVEEFVSEYQISDYEIIKIKTEGDIKSAKGETLFDKAHFVTDIQKCLLSGKADIAIHSAKDTPAKETKDISRIFLLSKSSKDILIYKDAVKFDNGMRIGTSSLRRQLQAKYHLGSSNVFNLSGNIDTRLEKLYKGEYDCIILAKAGLERLKILDEHTYEEMKWITASGQGTLAIEYADYDLEEIPGLNMQLTYDENFYHQCHSLINADRFVLDKINADCNSAVSIQTRIQEGSPYTSGEIYGKNKYISFSGWTPEEVIKSIERQEGMKLLNEHN